jgi:hypothetical protein
LAASPAELWDSSGPKVTFDLEVAYRRLDAGASFALDDAEKATVFSWDEDAVATVTLVDIATLDHAAVELVGLADNVPQGVTVAWSRRIGLPRSHRSATESCFAETRNLKSEIARFCARGPQNPAFL